MNSKDISPELLKKIEDEFDSRVKKSPWINRFYRKVGKGKGTIADLQIYSIKIGSILGDVYRDVFVPENLPNGSLYWNIIENTVLPTYEHNHSLIMSAGKQIEDTFYTKHGMNVSAAGTKFNKSLALKSLNYADNGIDLKTKVQRLSNGAKASSIKMCDTFVQSEFERRDELGMEVKLQRTLGGNESCEFCTNLEGTYNYNDTFGSDVWNRHSGCECIIEIIDNGKVGVVNNYVKRKK